MATFPRDLFPKLALSADEEDEFAIIANGIVKKTVQQYIEHLTTYNGVVDDKQWRQVKHRDNMRVYRERNVASRHRLARALAGGDTSDDNVIAKETPDVLTVGSIEGALDDFMYGALNPTTAAAMLRTAYVEDGFVHSEVLASIIQPTQKSPFRELDIKWTVKTYPSLFGATTRTLDAVYLESIGYAFTPSGERIGFHIHHSITLPAIRELSELQVIRTELSFCHLFRQLQDNVIEVFARGHVTPTEASGMSTTAALAADMTVTLWKNLHCAEVKKFVRVLRRALQLQSAPAITSSTDSSSDESHRAPAPTSGPCSVCSEGGSRRMSILSFSGKAEPCHLCRQNVCARCRVIKLLYLQPSAPDIATLKESATTLMVCKPCADRVTHADSCKFAENDAVRLDASNPEAAEFGLDFVDSLLPPALQAQRQTKI
uniref:FYVE-type domain-containing protein n=1 Tax=Globisporangium ultimum (strain ATCC 200006 / CBS 805.95 / DAOM BR144) TaxID=431595 RepID=K3W6C7_GLOUD